MATDCGKRVSMYSHDDIDIYEYIYICTTFMRMHIHICVYIYVRIHIYIYVYIYIYVHLYLYVFIGMYYTYTHTHTHTHTYIYKHIYIRICIHNTHTCISTHSTRKFQHTRKFYAHLIFALALSLHQHFGVPRHFLLDIQLILQIEKPCVRNKCIGCENTRVWYHAVGYIRLSDTLHTLVLSTSV